MSRVPSACAKCGRSFDSYHNVQRYCSEACRLSAHNDRHPIADPHRDCRTCGATFVRSGRGHSNKQHCSTECAAASARRVRREFDRRRPERDAIYRGRQKAKRQRDTSLERLWKKYPWMPRECEACGEGRVLDIAHRPEHARRGAWRTMANTSPGMIWVLCPTCHALLDRLGFSAEQLGIRPRNTEAA